MSMREATSWICPSGPETQSPSDHKKKKKHKRSRIPPAPPCPQLTSEEAEQAAFLHQLHDDPVRLWCRADSKQWDEVTMAEVLQDLNLRLKLTVVQLRVWDTKNPNKYRKESSGKKALEQNPAKHVSLHQFFLSLKWNCSSLELNWALPDSRIVGNSVCAVSQKQKGL